MAHREWTAYRGTTAQCAAVTPAQGEPLWDTEAQILNIGDGSTAGGLPIMMASGGTFTGAVTFGGTATFNAAVIITSSLDVAGAVAVGAPVLLSSTLRVAGFTTLAAMSTTGIRFFLRTAPAGTHIYINADNAGDLTINALISKAVILAVAGTDVVTISGTLVTIAQAVTLSSSLTLGGVITCGGYGLVGAGNIQLNDTKSINTGQSDNDYYTLKADDTGVGLVEVARAQGAADPYFSMGGSQQFKFYYSGVATFGAVTSSSTTGWKTTATFVPDATRTNYAFSIGNRAAELTVNLANDASQNLELFQMNVNLTASGGVPTSTSAVRLVRVRSTHDTVDMPHLRLMNINTYMDVQKSLQDAYGVIHGIDFYTNSITVGGEAAAGVFNIDANSGVTGTVRGVIINVYGAGLPASTSIGLEVRTDGGSATLGEGIRVWSVGGNSINYGLYIDGTINTADIRFSGGATLVDDGTSLTLAGSNLVVPTLTATTITDGTATLTSGEWTGATLNAMVAKGTWTASGTWTIPAVTLNGTLSLNAQVIDNGASVINLTTTVGGRALQVTSTSGGSDGAGILLFHDSDSPFAGDFTEIEFYGDNSTGNPIQYLRFIVTQTVVTAGSEETTLSIYTQDSGANLAMTLSAAGLLSCDAAGAGTALPTLFDKYDDALVLREGIQKQNREFLSDIGVMSRKDTGSGYMLNFQPMMNLLAGGIYQTRQRIDDLVDVLVTEFPQIAQHLVERNLISLN